MWGKEIGVGDKNYPDKRTMEEGEMSGEVGQIAMLLPYHEDKIMWAGLKSGPLSHEHVEPVRE